MPDIVLLHHSDAIVGVDCHNIAHAVRLADGSLDSCDGDVWRQMGGRWWVKSNTWKYPTVVTIPETVAALDERNQRA